MSAALSNITFDRTAGSRSLAAAGQRARSAAFIRGGADMDRSTEQLLGYMMAMVLLIVPTWKIFSRAGLAPSLSFLIFVPGVGVLSAGLVLAIRRWPSLESER